jgi:RimJ/RimL family protein N-acetyltransferase
MALRIETERLILRPMEMGDVKDLYEYQSNPEIVRLIPWPVRTNQQVAEAAEKVISSGKSELTQAGDYIVLVWQLKSSGKVIGQSNMGLISAEHKTANIGWVTHQDYQSKGYAYEATKSLLAYAFTHFDLHRVIADIDTRTEISANLAKKLGMRCEATYIESEFFKGEWCNMWLYAILKREFSA